MRIITILLFILGCVHFSILIFIAPPDYHFHLVMALYLSICCIVILLNSILAEIKDIKKKLNDKEESKSDD